MKKMNKYEAVTILESNTEEVRIEEIIEVIKDKIIADEGKVTKVEKIGLKKLAYEINKNPQGYYVVIQFESKKDTVAEIERYFRITEEIIKFIVVKMDE